MECAEHNFSIKSGRKMKETKKKTHRRNLRRENILESIKDCCCRSPAFRFAFLMHVSMANNSFLRWPLADLYGYGARAARENMRRSP